MSQSPIFDRIADLLKKESRIWSNDTEPKLLKGTLVSLANSDDADLLTLLLGDSTAREQFFVIAGDATVFRKERFIQFVTMDQFLPNSFTAFENKIGLTKDGKYLSGQNEVALVFPYKDCILEAGQTKEDKGRDEIFYNTVLAPDEIDRLKEPKVLTKWKRFTRDDIEGKQPVTEVTHTDNLVIKGNNLLALYSLLPRYRGQVKLIYIDPPYNTGNDGFRYNDSFNHSSWLVFMKNRLEVSRELLREDGSIWINIDDNESHYLKVLCDEIFGRENFVANVIWQKKYAATNDTKYISDLHDHILIFSKNKESWKPNLLERPKELNAKYSNPDNDPRGDWYPTNLSVKTFSQKNYFEIISPNGNKFLPPPTRCWVTSKEKYQELLSENRIWFGKKGESRPYQKTFLSEVQQGVVPTSVWLHSEVGHTIGAKTEMRTLFTDIDDLFATPKPERLLQRILEIGSKENDLVLDFFAGSGTTCAVAHKMGRQYIGIEQMDYIHDLPEARLKKVIEGEQGGISKAVNWHGGGSFVYCELLEWNQRHINALEKASTKKEVEVVKAKMEREQFFRYNYDPSQWEGKAFDALSIDEQKKVLLDMLDMNHLYVNKTSIAETTFTVGDEDKALNKQFYTVTR